jgi:hypothetical protein
MPFNFIRCETKLVPDVCIIDDIANLSFTTRNKIFFS